MIRSSFDAALAAYRSDPSAANGEAYLAARAAFRATELAAIRAATASKLAAQRSGLLTNGSRV